MTDPQPLQAEHDGQLNAAYRERAHLLAWLSATAATTAVLAPAPDVDEPGWWVLFLYADSWRQMTWHIHPRDLDLFDGVERVAEGDPRAQWDGHSTETKYRRMRAWTARLQERRAASTPADAPVFQRPEPISDLAAFLAEHPDADAPMIDGKPVVDRPVYAVSQPLLQLIVDQQNRTDADRHNQWQRAADLTARLAEQQAAYDAETARLVAIIEQQTAEHADLKATVERVTAARDRINTLREAAQQDPKDYPASSGNGIYADAYAYAGRLLTEALTVDAGAADGPSTQASAPNGICTATIAPPNGGRYQCTLTTGHYDGTVWPAPGVDDNPGGWHQSAPGPNGRFAWADEAIGATPAGRPSTQASAAAPPDSGASATAVGGCTNACVIGHMYDDCCSIDPLIPGVIGGGWENGRQQWAWRCEGHAGCDGMLSLDHGSAAEARRAYDRHCANHHGSTE